MDNKLSAVEIKTANYFGQKTNSLVIVEKWTQEIIWLPLASINSIRITQRDLFIYTNDRTFSYDLETSEIDLPFYSSSYAINTVSSISKPLKCFNSIQSRIEQEKNSGLLLNAREDEF